MTRYSEEAEAIKQRARRVPLRILIWGPGVPDPNASRPARLAYQLRLDMRNALRTAFSSAEVFFPEDPEMQAIAPDIADSLLREALLASVADLILVLGLTRGAELELDYFIPKYPWMRDKIHVFLPQKYVSSRMGLVSEVFKYVRPEQVEGFTPEDLQSGTLVTQKVIRVADTFALRKLLLSDL